MKAKLNDLIKSGLVWVAFNECDKFINYAANNNVRLKVGNIYKEGFIFMFAGAVIC